VILIDTDICIEILRGNRKVIKKSSQYDGVIAVSFMTVGELHYGVHNSGNPEKNELLVEQFLLTVVVIESDFNIMRRFGIIKSELKTSNILLPDADILIAATVREKCDMLVTGNTKHFERIDGLVIENWRV